MKKIILSFFACIAMATIGFGQVDFGAGVALELDGPTFGVHGKVAFGINDNLKGQGGFTYYFEKNNVNIWSLDGDVHYLDLVTLGENIQLNPFAGLNISNYSFDVVGVSSSSTDIGINLGASFLIPSGDNLVIFIEPKIVIDGIDGFVITGGVMF